MSRLIDGREMQPPEPLERTLEALDDLGNGEQLELLLYCQPNPLFQILRRNGYRWTEDVLGDGTHRILISKAD